MTHEADLQLSLIAKRQIAKYGKVRFFEAIFTLKRVNRAKQLNKAQLKHEILRSEETHIQKMGDKNEHTRSDS